MRSRISVIFAVLAIVFAALPGQSLATDAISAGALRIMHPWARASAGHGDTGAAFMAIANTGSEDDKLLAVSTAIARKAEVHETTMDGGVMKMRMLMGGLAIPAGGQVELKPMGLHVMLMGLTEKLIEGETLTLTLIFEKAGSVELAVPVTGPGAMMAPGMQ